MQLSYEPAKGEDAPAIFAFARELIERYETDPDLDLSMALDWTRRKIEKRIDEYTRVLADGEIAAYYRLAPDGERLELRLHGQYPGHRPLRAGGLSQGRGCEPHPVHHGARWGLVFWRRRSMI